MISKLGYDAVSGLKSWPLYFFLPLQILLSQSHGAWSLSTLLEGIVLLHFSPVLCIERNMSANSWSGQIKKYQLGKCIFKFFKGIEE